jgi:formate hydrogenlyase subunit 6/NADH:ubiquinone oxidoreductase subunit I
MKAENCNLCENSCPSDALKCHRGRDHFGVGAKDENLELPLKMLLKCGHMLHHGKAPSENLLASLEQAEQAELVRLLTKLSNDWQERAPQN